MLANGSSSDEGEGDEDAPDGHELSGTANPTRAAVAQSPTTGRLTGQLANRGSRSAASNDIAQILAFETAKAEERARVRAEERKEEALLRAEQRREDALVRREEREALFEQTRLQLLEDRAARAHERDISDQRFMAMLAALTRKE